MADVSESFVASVAQVLNSDEIPCVLWGHYLLNVHGVPSIIGSIDFVIPDDRLVDGMKAFTRISSLTQCPDKETCPTSSRDRTTPPPAFHTRINNTEVTVNIYSQSETMWFLPPFANMLSFPLKSKLPAQFALASDDSVLPAQRPGRGSGVFKSSHNHIVVPKSHIMLEAFLRLYARDSGKRIGTFAIAMIAYVMDYIDSDGLLDINQLPEPLKTFYIELKQGEKPVYQWTKELKDALAMCENSEDDPSKHSIRSHIRSIS